MKKQMSIIASFLFLLASVNVNAQTDKSKRQSPPDKVSATIKSGATISVDYSQPSVKGRTIGKEIAPFGAVWRTGANEATVFEVSKDVTIDGKVLAAGKYSLYSIPGEDQWTVIFNKTWNQWGTKYAEADDALRIKVKPVKSKNFVEKMTFNVDKSGEVKLMWGDWVIPFTVK